MTKRPIFPFFFVLLLLGSSTVPAQSARMPRGSFLREPAHSATQLALQIRRDPIVAARYEKHFNVPAVQFASYAQSQLGLRPLKHGGSYRVFFIRKDGSIGSSMRNLRKGTAVFIHLRTGKPVLLAECGNPMGNGLPGYPAPTSQKTTPREPVRTADASGEETVEVLPPPIQSPAPDVFEEPALIQTQLGETPLWAADVALTVPDLPISSSSSLAHASSASWTPLLMFGAGEWFSLGGSPPGRGGGGNPPPAVPEPSSLLLWAVAGAGAAFAKARRAKSLQLLRTNISS
ncbi:MAG: hypothetical protein NZ749_04285 [bacterium]|nr:hypothetical protein [bacterium]